MTGAALAVMAAMTMGGSGDAGPTVAVPGRFYAPQHINVLVGQAVTWRNDDATDHTVTSPDAGSDSGRVGHGALRARLARAVGGNALGVSRPAAVAAARR